MAKDEATIAADLREIGRRLAMLRANALYRDEQIAKIQKLVDKLRETT